MRNILCVHGSLFGGRRTILTVSNEKVTPFELGRAFTKMRLDKSGKERPLSTKNVIASKLVLVGASAGGLKPITHLLTQLKLDSTAAVVVAMHMAPGHDSYLAELLAKSTKYSVKQAQQDEPLEPKTIYVIPPDCHMELVDGQFRRIYEDIIPQPNINRLFESAAQLESTLVIGVVLSGTGSDGTKGLLSIKTHGGISFVQDPPSAEYDAMPQSALDSDAADFIMTPDEIGRSISLILRKKQFPEIENKLLAANSEAGISSVLEYLFAERQVDLHNYKDTTLRRRIFRRVALGGFTDIEQYLLFLKQNTTELESLINDIFISVTQFMRDKNVWKRLQDVIVSYLNQSSEKVLRVWSVGCSTGEEAYSWAILLEEIKLQWQLQFDYVIFATDISEKSIAQARRSVYDISLEDELDEGLIKKYFVKNQYGYQVVRYLRDKIVYSTHNFLLDPPFSNIDLLSCRNVLIYFNQKLQKRAISAFAYSLVSDGLLVLGSNESVGHKSRYFKELDKENKIFQRTEVVATLHVATPSPMRQSPKRLSKVAKQKEDNSLLQLIQARIAEHTGCEAVLIDEKDEIVFSYFRDDSIVQMKPGRFSRSVFDYLNQNHRAALRALILKCRRTNKPVKHVDSNGHQEPIAYHVLPCQDPENWLVLVFSKPEIADAGTALQATELSGGKLVTELEAELNSTRHSLQAVVEELEQTNEALQSSNEELQSSNEELQATNEELQTANEELQSSNEELRTLNEELRIKNNELDLVTSHLRSVEENLETP